MLPNAGCPSAAQLRKGYTDGADIAHELLPRLAEWGAAAATLHGRTRQQRCAVRIWHRLPLKRHRMPTMLLQQNKRYAS